MHPHPLAGEIMPGNKSHHLLRINMDAKKLSALENAAWKLSSYLADLVEVETVPNLIIPEQHATREDYIIHLGNMIGHYRMEVGRTYNAIDEWQDA